MAEHMLWNTCLNGACTRFEKPTQERACPVCGEHTSLYEPPATVAVTSARRAEDENARRVAERRQQWSKATGVPLAARADLPHAAVATTAPPGASSWNYLWLLLGIIGGIAGNLLVRDDDPVMAKRLIIWGAVVTLVCVILTVLI